ncbi:1063_t:CDS:2 [Ambispora gerdemannii]|uniref:1063_t:CDS:1 n=1 Tax=Ambispora gerdemannii TaxID=144530 RepID=A0A9N8V7Z5_9GLOM|nr:1063_t:CDS:2 [Ambispora gerdemannii]
MEGLLSSGHLVENDSIQLQTYIEALETINRHSPRKRPRSATSESEYEIVSDIGSGLNWKRRGFVALLERIHAGGIEEVVVTQRNYCVVSDSSLWNGSLRRMGLGTDVSAKSNEAGKLAEDLLSIVTVFVARHNGIRSAANRRRRREATQAQEDQEFQDPSRQDTMYPSLSYTRRAVETQTMDRTARWTYNQCLIADLRAQYLNAINFKNDTKLKWIIETPYDVQDEVMNDLLKGYSSNFVANHKKFKMKFCFKKDSRQSIAILFKCWDKSRGEYAFLHKIKSAEPLPNQLEYDSVLL